MLLNLSNSIKTSLIISTASVVATAAIFAGLSDNDLSSQVLSLALIFIAVGLSSYWAIEILIVKPQQRSNRIVEILATTEENFDENLRRFINEKNEESSASRIHLTMLISRLINIYDEVNDVVDQLSGISIKSSEISNKASNGVIHQHNEAASISNTTEQITTAAREVANNSAVTAESAKQAGNDAATGFSVIEDVVQSIEFLAADVNSAVEVIQNLEAESDQIGSILNVISDISDQTNLLALNAAIEAARAGEMGRGFAVVADEVRELSRKTAEATNNIKDMIERLQSGSKQAAISINKGKEQAKESIEKALKGRESLLQINSAVDNISQMSEQTANAVTEQSSSTEQINLGIRNLSEIIEQSATLAEENAASSKEQFLLLDYMKAITNLNNSVINETTIKIYAYQNLPPFVTGPKQGLTYELAEYLNRIFTGRYKFVIYRLPRSRLDQLIDKGIKGLVPWTNPVWHGDPNQTKFDWTPGYHPDSNNLISSKEQPFNYAGPQSMKGKVLGGLTGYVYLHLDDMAKAGELKRINVSTVEENIKRVMSKRIDTALVTESTARYIVSSMNLNDKIHFSDKKHQEYTYQMLCGSVPDELKKELKTVVGNMLNDTEWKNIKEKYR